MPLDPKMAAWAHTGVRYAKSLANHHPSLMRLIDLPPEFAELRKKLFS